MANLFNQAQIDQINAIAAKSKTLKPVKASKSITATQNSINESTQAVLEYFKDSPAILITTREALHNYVLKAIEAGYCGIDTETTGTDRIHDTIVGFSLYYPGGTECYIPCKHRTLVDTFYKEQISYEDAETELSLFVEAKTKMIFANADFDLAFIYKDFKVDMIDICYYDVILAWRCLKENEPKNDLKTLYWKYPNKGQGSPKKFSDFFSPKYFPYSRPDIAKLYAANDAKITYELFAWQLPYVTKSNPKCQKHHLEKIADLIWNIEFPMIKVCALMHRTGIYLDIDSLNAIKKRYHDKYNKESTKLAEMVQEVIDQADIITITKSPFKTGDTFNQASPPQVKYLFNQFMHLDLAAADKEVLKELNLPIANQILKVRSISTLINGFIDKMTGIIGPDNRVHSTFKSIGADTGRMCIAKGTKIACLDGQKNIEDIVPGDLVYCYDDRMNLQTGLVKNLWLTGKNKECVRVSWINSNNNMISSSLICTPEHPIFTKSGKWVEANKLSVGDELVCWTEPIEPIVSNVTSAGTYDVYDIEVEKFHNFIAEGICVHNSSADPNVQNIPSHALDIRHQFRATPAMMEVSDCTVQEEGITVTLGNYDIVWLDDGSPIKVHSLNIGDRVQLMNNKKEVIGIVKSISNQAPNTCICFDVQ